MLVRQRIIEKAGRMLSPEEYLPVALQRPAPGRECLFHLAKEEETGGDPVVLTQKDVRRYSWPKVLSGLVFK